MDTPAEDYSKIRWSSHYTVENAPVEFNYGDKAVLPPSALEQLLAQIGISGTLPSPLTFELRHPHSGATIHCGVKEFSSESSTIQLPNWIRESLGLSQGDHVLIKLSPLPKGTFARLKPTSQDYRDITDYRAALEAHLRVHYNTLTNGQTLSCRYGGRVYDFQVMELKPQDAVSITDTDLEVEMDPITSISTKSNIATTIIQLNQVVAGTIIAAGHYQYWKLELDKSSQVSLNIKVEGGDADVVISSTDKSPTLDNHEWSDLSSEVERTINIKDVTANAFIVGIHGYRDAVVTWEATSQIKDGVDMTTKDEQASDTTGKVQCKNCHAWIAERTLMLHEGFCYRNNVVCEWGCGKIFKKDSRELQEHWHCNQCDATGNDQYGQDKHMAYCHTPKICVCANFTAQSFEALAEHRRTICAEKLIICRYCHTLVAQGDVSLDPRDRLLGLHSHESYCGSRTITCQKCNKPVSIKDITVHAKIHDVKRQQQILPPTCCNRNCIRPKQKNRLALCQYCFGPFWITEDDPKNVKLIQRVARKIHSQLTVGCGNRWCRNKYCATSTNDPKDATTAASVLIPMIKNLPKELSSLNPNPELYFCVDESVTRKMFLAELLVNQVDGKYDLGWCVVALENNHEDLDKAQQWLDGNAPRKNVRY
ncbi:ubiquitin fusion degradation protein UFD1-domain-containing protein [Parasitella parasitica]|nr:ubiquitin fusion degradation protein UFD1-domain-containing protein [Parasitella parasitica]